MFSSLGRGCLLAAVGAGIVTDFESNCSTCTARRLLGRDVFTGEDEQWEGAGDDRVTGITVGRVGSLSRTWNRAQRSCQKDS